jgi:LDH2 family malate/lactate/ureidoglycolate dehydrogenase
MTRPMATEPAATPETDAGGGMFRARREDMLRLGQVLLERAGAPSRSARIVMDHLVASSAMRLHSHGVMRIPQYLADIEAGVIDAAAEPEFAESSPSRLNVDGRRGFGQVVGMLMVERLTPLARAIGIALANGRRLGHTGRIGAYPEALAEAGLIGLAVCNGAPSGHWVAPFGGRDGRISTNPIAVAWPVQGEAPVVADFSTAAAPEGVIRVLRDLGATAPEGYLRHADGRSSRDPNVLYATPRGTIQPLGGALGYRGTALALFVEVLTTLLNGDAVDDRSRQGTDMTLVAIAPQPGFERLARGLSDHIRASPPLDPARPVLMPGDRERAAADGAGSILVNEPTWTALAKAAERAQVPMPVPLGDAGQRPTTATDNAEVAE